MLLFMLKKRLPRLTRYPEPVQLCKSCLLEDYAHPFLSADFSEVVSYDATAATEVVQAS